jgi:hypothetical protein
MAKLKNNNSDLTPRGYDSYNLYKDEKTELNVLFKKTFLDKHFYKILFIGVLIVLLCKHWSGISIMFNIK